MNHLLKRTVTITCLTAAAFLAVSAAWIPVKAEVAQMLLLQAWKRARLNGASAKPWPWADTWPIARLRVPRHGIDAIVLAGASGSALAFGPGHVDGTAPPGQCGTCVLSGHRDTHFGFLARLRLGDILELEASDGRVQRFAVRSTHILRRADLFVEDGGEDVLILTTCYPFDAVVPGGPLRFVVRAVES
jgi:sortase A